MSQGSFYQTGSFGKSIISLKPATVQRCVQQKTDPKEIIYQVKNVLKGDEEKFLRQFQEEDINNCGMISNLQFKKIMRQWGYSSRDIDLLFSIVEQSNGNIDYRQFLRKLSMNP